MPEYRCMKKIMIYFTLGCLAFAPLMAKDADEGGDSEAVAVTRDDKKAAAAWYKEDMANKKKALALFKKIKDEKSAEKSAKAVLKMYGLDREGEQTAMGEVGERTTPTGPAMEAEAKKVDKARAKLINLLQNEQERVAGLQLDTEEVSRAFSAAIR